MLGELKRTVTHDCARCEYRRPLGAVTCGSQTEIRLRADHSAVLRVYIVLICDGMDRKLPMNRADGAYRICIDAPASPCVVWYHFCLATAEREYYYGARPGSIYTSGDIYTDNPPPFQLTVYDGAFAVPDWCAKSVMYQIFPDRFAKGVDKTAEAGIAYHSSMGRRVSLHGSFDEPVKYTAEAGEKDYYPNDFYGGTLRGMTAKLPYLKKLGAGVIYLNPVFESDSNHRYATSDYLRIDPILGSNDDFSELVQRAREMGIRVILDGVFSHTGSDSVYFNRAGTYLQPGAYQGESSPYYGWYDFYEFPDKYRCWWGFTSLPEVNEHNGSWRDFVITGEHSVLKTWIERGASGYRLDVADELPDDTLSDMRTAVKTADPQALLLGEVWEDATTKQSYGQNRRYALGRALDSVMNYPLRNAIVDFLQGKSAAAELAVFLCGQRLNYPLPMYYALMNLLSSHDIERIRTALAVRMDARELSREQQAGFYISQPQNDRGRALQRLAAAVQFALPGMPCIYYGDEQGMNGFLDPFNRMPFAEKRGELCDYYAELAKIRNNCDAMTMGSVAFFTPHPDVLGILRFVTDGRDAFGNPAENGCLLTLVNRSVQARKLVIDLHDNVRLLSDEQKRALHAAQFTRATCLITGQTAEINDGLLFFEPAAVSAYIFELA